MGEMTVHVEVWPVVADRTGLWLIGDEQWIDPLPIPADSEPDWEAELLLGRHGIRRREDLALLHSTSWRPIPAHGRCLMTYIACIDAEAVLARGEEVKDRWPAAEPISLELANHVGRPPAHGPTDRPTPRDIDVLYHAIRHVAFLVEHDAAAAAGLQDTHWTTHLRVLRPALASMYQHGLRAA